MAPEWQFRFDIDRVADARFKGRVDVLPGPRPSDRTLQLRDNKDLPAIARDLTQALGWSLGTIVATDEGGSFQLRYIFEPGTGHAMEALPDHFLSLLVQVTGQDPRIPSIAAVVPAANWHEREFQDLFGITAVGHPDPRPLVLHDDWPAGEYPLRKTFQATTPPTPKVIGPEFPHLKVEGVGVFEIPVGPYHAGIIEPGHFRFSSVGEVILNLEARLFYTHRGIEKRLEGLDSMTAFHVVERVCGVCSVAHSLAFCEAVEQLHGAPIPKRAQMIRTILLELERLYNHAGDLGNICAGASYHFGTSLGLRLKESLQQLNEALTGSRFLRGLITPGGLRQDVTTELVGRIVDALAQVEPGLEDLMRRIDANPSVGDRFEGTGLLLRKAAIDLALTGVAARASGVHRDARRDHPHASYRSGAAPELKLAHATDGDVMARVQVRYAEALESIRLIRALVTALPSGAFHERLPSAPPAGEAIASVESPRGATLHWLRVGRDGRIDRYHIRSPSYANWPAVALAGQTAILPDFPLVNKSFELCYSCTDR